MARIPKRLFGPAQLTAATATKYTVPALTKTIIRHIHISNNSGSAVPVTISIGADAAGTRILDAYSIPAAAVGVTGSVVDLYGYWVLDAAEIVAAFAGTTLVIDLTLNGDEIVLG
jgi:hypothetical protein